jgi:hypothetical protein
MSNIDTYAHAEIDPDHFDSPNTQPVLQPSAADSKVTVTRYDRTFSLPIACRATVGSSLRESILSRSAPKAALGTRRFGKMATASKSRGSFGWTLPSSTAKWLSYTTTKVLERFRLSESVGSTLFSIRNNRQMAHSMAGMRRSYR